MKNSKTDVNKRQALILNQLKHREKVHINQLSKELNVSPITIRRDLKEFEDQGIVERFHGGAKLINPVLLNISPLNSFTLNESQEKAKHAIAQYAASQIKNGDIIFFNSSSTCLLMLEYLANKSITIITNNARIVSVACPPSIEILLTGGELNDRNRSLVGDFAAQSLMNIIADKTFLGINGISADRGLTSCIVQQTIINKLMMERCNGNCFVLADYSKIGVTNSFSSGSLDMVSTLVTDPLAPQEELDKIAAANIEIVLVGT